MKIIGTTTDIDKCDCCGKTNLQKTVILETTAGATIYYGTDCAAKAILGSKSKKNASIIDLQARAIQAAKAWLQKGFSPEVVAESIYNRYGFLTDIKSGLLLIGSFGQVQL